MKAKEISGKLYKSPYYDTPKSPTTLSPTAKLDKSSSFKKKAKPEYLERLAREHAENKENKRVSAERVKECNIVLLGDLGVGKTGDIFFLIFFVNELLIFSFLVFFHEKPRYKDIRGC